MKKSVQNKTVAALLLIATALSLTACKGIQSTPEVLTSKYIGDLTEEQMKEEGLYGAILYNLLARWGKAWFNFGAGENRENCVWVAGDRYLQVTFDGHDPYTEKAIAARVFRRMKATVTDAETMYIRPEDNFALHGDKVFFSKAWLSEEQAAKCKVGTELMIDFDGLLMETYPMQIHEPYRVQIWGFHEIE